MLKTSKRHLELLSWLYWNGNIQTWSQLQFYAFLFLYELQSIKEERKTSTFTNYDISSLVATKDGPVFTTLHEDMFSNYIELRRYVEPNKPFKINTQWARAFSFVISSITEQELKDIMREFHMWRRASQQFEAQSEVPMLEKHIVEEEDFALLQTLLDAVPEYEYEILEINDKRFVLSTEDCQSASIKHFNILLQLSRQEHLYNPVYIEIDANGHLIVND
jgi:hypothetical protein